MEGERQRWRGARQRSDVRPNGKALLEHEVEGRHRELRRSGLREGQASRHTRMPQGRDRRDREVGAASRTRAAPRRRLAPRTGNSRSCACRDDNKEWNAMAMGNGASDLPRHHDEMTDPELALVVGHELASNHEHSRRQ